MLCGSHCTTFWKRQDFGGSENIIGCQGLGERGRSEQAGPQQIFRAVKILRTVPSWRVHDSMHSSEPTECVTQQGNPKENLDFSYDVSVWVHQL